ncbi:MAG TPA: hypothetical protein VKV28_06405 [Candidatus Binataceae bacterium]|nr:hypothetical protein [Candidatus Binataceae bacterium]
MRRDWVNVRMLGLLSLALVVGACGSSSKSTPPPTPSSFGLLATVQLPAINNKPAILASFDISWFDDFEGNQNVWFTDAGNNAVDQIDTANNTFVQYINQGGFGGNNSPTDHDCNGPNGAVTAIGPNNSFHELWVGDIAKPTPCGTGSPQIWAFDLTKTPPTANFGGPIALNCGVGGLTPISGDPSNASLNPVACPSAGAQIERADELSYDSTDDVILIAVPHPSPGLVNATTNPAGCATAVGQNCGPYVNIINAGSGKVLGQIVFPQATNGIEQSQWDAKTDTFFVNLPYDSDLGNDANGNPIGAVAKIKINSVNPLSVTVSVPTTPTAPYSTIVSCSANGLSTINPANRNMLLGCANSVAPNSNFPSPFPTTGSATNLAEVMNADTGLVVAVPLTGVQADEVWYDDFNNVYYESGLPGGAVQLGATNAATNAVVANFLMAHTPPPHSVTADSVNGHVIMPGPLNNDTWDNSASLTFPNGATSPGNFSCTKGCVWVFGLSPNNSYPVE